MKRSHWLFSPKLKSVFTLNFFLKVFLRIPAIGLNMTEFVPDHCRKFKMSGTCMGIRALCMSTMDHETKHIFLLAWRRCHQSTSAASQGHRMHFFVSPGWGFCGSPGHLGVIPRFWGTAAKQTSNKSENPQQFLSYLEGI